MLWTASATCLQAAACRLRRCENACERGGGALSVAGLHGQSDDDVRRRGVSMASKRKLMRQVPPNDVPRAIDGTPALQPAQPLVQNQGAQLELAGVLSDRRRRTLPSPQAGSPRSRRPTAHQTHQPKRSETTLAAERDRRWPAVSAFAPAHGGPHSGSPAALRTQPEPLLVHNLLNDL